MAPHSSTLAWKIPWMEEPGRLQSMGSLEPDTTEWLHFHALEKEMATHSTVLAWRIPRTGKPGGLPSMGSHRVGHDWSDLAAVAAATTHYFAQKLHIHLEITLSSNNINYYKQRSIAWFTFWFVHVYIKIVLFTWNSIQSI